MPQSLSMEATVRIITIGWSRVYWKHFEGNLMRFNDCIGAAKFVLRGK